MALSGRESYWTAAGAHTVLNPTLTQEAGWHLMGTARMGDDPRSSVVDRHGRAHDVPNLFIVDGSLFATSAAVNPTSTIQALALYVSDWLKQKLPGGGIMTEQQENGTILTTEQLALLEAIQNRLIPAQDGMPGAGDAGCPMTIDRFLSERPALRRTVIAALNAVEAAAAGAASEGTETATAGATHVAFLSLTNAARRRSA